MAPYVTLGPDDTTGDQWGAGMGRGGGSYFEYPWRVLFWSYANSETQIELQIKNLKHLKKM